MTNSSKKSILISKIAICVFSLLFVACSMFENEKQNPSFTIKLPNTKQSKTPQRSVSYNKTDNTIAFNEKGRVNLEDIDFFEISVTPSSGKGKSITKSAPNGTESITFEDLEAGEYIINFWAYVNVVSDNASNEDKIMRVATNKTPIKATIKAGETTQVNIEANLIDYIIKNESISFSALNTGKLSGNFLTPISEQFQFIFYNEIYSEIEESDAVVKIEDDGTLTPLKAGTSLISYKRLIDDFEASQNNSISVTVVPAINIKYIINGIDVSNLFYLYNKIYADSTDTLTNSLKNFLLATNLIQEFYKDFELSTWYTDQEYTTPITVTPESIFSTLDLSNLYNSADTALTQEIKLYAKATKTITDYESLKAAFTNGGDYIWDATGEYNTISISEELTTPTSDNPVTVSITVKGNATIKRTENFTGQMIKVDDGSELYIKVEGENSNVTIDGSLSDGSTVKGKLIQLNSNSKSYFENVIFKNNKVGEDWANPAAISVSGLAEFKNCTVSDNSISGNHSRASGIKIEGDAIATLDTMTFKNNSCDSYPYGKDIWIEEGTANVCIKGKITSDDTNNGISLYIKKGAGETLNPIEASEISDDSSNFGVTYNNTTDDNYDPTQPEADLQLFNFGENGSTLKDKFSIYKKSDSGNTLEKNSKISLSADGKVTNN